MASVTRDQDQKPPASALSSLGRGAGAGFDIFTSISCFLLSSRPALGSGCSVSRCFIPVFPLAGSSAERVPGGEGERGPPPARMGGGGAGTGGGPPGKKILAGALQRINPQLLDSREAQLARLTLLQQGRCEWGWRVGMDGSVPTSSGDSHLWGAERCGGLSVPPGYLQLQPLPSPPLSPPGFSQLIPLAASLRHLQGLKTATVPALTPGDPHTLSPAPSGRCLPRPHMCPPAPGG